MPGVLTEITEITTALGTLGGDLGGALRRRPHALCNVPDATWDRVAGAYEDGEHAGSFRAAFENGGAAVQLHADFAPRMWDGDSCAPIVIDGPVLARVKARLARRALAVGHGPEAKPRQASRRRREGAVSSG